MPSLRAVSAQPVKIGVVGLGRFGRLHALTAAGLSEAELVALVARRPAALDALTKELPGVPGWTDLDRALLESEAEAWIVACTTADHVSVTRELLVAGKTVLLEKPISADLAEAQSLAPWVRADSGNLMLGHIVLFNSEFQQLREEAARRGPIALIDGVRHRPASIVAQFPGENPLHAAMIHDLYLTQVLMQREEPVSFHARYHRTAQGEVDLAVARLQWASGTIASLTASYLTPAGMPPRGFDRTEVFGDGWCGPTGMMAEEQRCFCRVVRGVQPVPVGATYGDALQVQQWMHQLAASAVGE
jgi:predicted dehydrogenase